VSIILSLVNNHLTTQICYLQDVYDFCVLFSTFGYSMRLYHLYKFVLKFWSGGTPRKVGWGCTAHFPKPLPYLWPKSVIFATLFMTWPKIWYPILYDRCGWHSCPKHELWRAFIDSLIDSDEKVASSKKHTQFKTRVHFPYQLKKVICQAVEVQCFSSPEVHFIEPDKASPKHRCILIAG